MTTISTQSIAAGVITANKILFSTATLAGPRPHTFVSDDAGMGMFKKNANGTGVITGLRIFRAGTFKDSMGEQRTWTHEHLEQMVNHFDMLKKGTLPNIPVRDGHPSLFGSGGSVIGYINSLKRDGDFLAAELDITEPDAMAKWERGTYRARSLEVGMYETNEGATYYPVVMGVAFVDIPAVEGLYAKGQPQGGEEDRLHAFQIMVDNKETPVTTPAGNQPNGTNDQGNGQTTDPATPPAGSSTDATGTENDKPTTPASAPAPAPAPAPPAEQPPSSHSANSAAGQFAFRVNGQPTQDFNAVQSHITALEGFARETRDQARRDYVSGLASAHKIAATQIDALTGLALTMTDEQFDAFKASYTDAPAAPLFGAHAGPGGTPTAPGTGIQDEIATLEEQIAMHKRAGTKQEQIEKMASYKRLQDLKTKTA